MKKAKLIKEAKDRFNDPDGEHVSGTELSSRLGLETMEPLKTPDISEQTKQP
jgi:hypothetical protein